MASKKEIEEHLEIALREVGKIKPWFEKDVDAWVFSHPSYPVEYAGESKEDVMHGYPLYLREFIKQRLNKNLSLNLEKRTKGRGENDLGREGQKGRKKRQKKGFHYPKMLLDGLTDQGPCHSFEPSLQKENRLHAINIG